MLWEYTVSIKVQHPLHFYAIIFKKLTQTIQGLLHNSDCVTGLYFSKMSSMRDAWKATQFLRNFVKIKKVRESVDPFQV